MVRGVGQLTDPYEDAEDEGLRFRISGLPDDEPEAPPVDDDIDVDFAALGMTGGDRERRRRSSDDDPDDDPVAGAGGDGDDDDREDGDGEGDGDEGPGEEVAYDLSEWDDDQLSALADALEEAGVDHAWHDDELFVRAEDEQLVDDLFEQVAHPHALPEEDDDGDAGGALLGELFVVADRLQRDPDEPEAVALLLRLANAAEDAEPPYGLGEDDWDSLRQRVDTLAEALEVDDPNLDEVMEAATQLRNAIRPYV
jgi:hypothetical protein